METKIDLSPIITIAVLGVAGYIAYKKFMSGSDSNLTYKEKAQIESEQLYTDITGKTGGIAVRDSAGNINMVGASTGNVTDYFNKALENENAMIIKKDLYNELLSYKPKEIKRVVTNTNSTFKNIYGENASVKVIGKSTDVLIAGNPLNPKLI